MDQYWEELSESQRDVICGIDDYATAIKERALNGSILRYLALAETAADFYCKLHEPENMKLERCVDAVRQWLG